MDLTRERKGSRMTTHPTSAPPPLAKAKLGETGASKRKKKMLTSPACTTAATIVKGESAYCEGEKVDRSDGVSPVVDMNVPPVYLLDRAKRKQGLGTLPLETPKITPVTLTILISTAA